MESNYDIIICTKSRQKEVMVQCAELDEAISFALTLFDKYSEKIGDYVIVSEVKTICQKSVMATYKRIPVRKITLEKGLKVDVKVY